MEHARPTVRRQAGRRDRPPTAVPETLRQPGRPLDPTTRVTMEQRFGQDFSRVRVHTDPAAAASARSIDATAYAFGRHLVFDTGRYAPGTPDGDRLLAHELTHVVQQRGQPDNGHGSLRLDARGDHAEHEADAVARAGAGPVGSLAPAAPTVRRQRVASTVADTLAARYRRAVRDAQQTGDWREAAELLNGFSHVDIQNRLAELTPEQVGQLHLGALDNPRVGAEAAVARLTRPDVPPASTEPPTSTPVPHGPVGRTTTDQAARPGGPSIAGLTPTQKLLEAYRRANIDAAVRQKILSLMSPEALVTAIIGFAVGFVAAQFTPVGWGADLALALTAVFAGTSLLTALRHLVNFAEARNATTSAELDQAGAEFAAAVAGIEIDAILLLITHRVAGGARAGAPYNGPPPVQLALAITPDGIVVPVVVSTVDAATAIALGTATGTRSAAAGVSAENATTVLMSRAQRFGGGPRTRDFEPPVRDHAGKAGGEIPESDAERKLAVDSWTRTEAEEAATELEQSIAARNAEQRRLGETSVGQHRQRVGAAHRDRIRNEEALLRASRKKLSGS